MNTLIIWCEKPAGIDSRWVVIDIFLFFTTDLGWEYNVNRLPKHNCGVSNAAIPARTEFWRFSGHQQRHEGRKDLKMMELLCLPNSGGIPAEFRRNSAVFKSTEGIWKLHSLNGFKFVSQHKRS